jgi:hypothetical protein
MDALYDRFRMLLIAAAVLLVPFTYLLIAIVHRSSSPPPMVAYADGRYFSGKPSRFNPTPEQVDAQANAVIEAIMTRTEAGTLPSLKPFLAPGVAAAADSQYARPKTANGPFYQSYAILGIRLYMARPTYRTYAIRGLLSSRTATGSQSSEVFLGARFDQGPPTQENPIGWRLTSLLPATSSDFFAPELNAERERRLTPPDN